MDLALSFGKTVGALEQEMSGVEFHLWQKYEVKRMLPWRRMEMHLAQISKLIVEVMGGNTDVVLSDFLFEMEDETMDDPVAFFGFAPRYEKDE